MRARWSVVVLAVTACTHAYQGGPKPQPADTLGPAKAEEPGSPATRRDVPTEVRGIIEEQLDLDDAQIRPELTFYALGADSGGFEILMLAFQQAFEIDLTDEEVERFATVQDAVDCIEAHLDAAGVATTAKVKKSCQ